MICPLDSSYKASLTREQFLFHEMRIVAKFMVDGKNESEIKLDERGRKKQCLTILNGKIMVRLSA